VLFVRRPKTDPALQASQVSLTPREIDLGEFKIGTREYSKVHPTAFTVENNSDRPVLVRNLYSSCNCGVVDWDGGVIAAGQKKEVPVRITPGGWGWGRVERFVTLEFADGSTAKFRMIANKPKPEEKQQISIEPEILRISLNPAVPDSKTLVQHARLNLGQTSLDQVKITSDSRWLAAELVQGKGKNGDVIVRIDSSQLEGSGFPVKGELLFTTHSDEAPVRLQVILSSQHRYVVTPPVVALGKGKTATIAIKPASSLNRPIGSSLPPADILSGPKGLSITCIEASPSEIQLQVGCTKDTPAGYEVISCRIGTKATGLEVQFIVHVD
jgi:hypothetical protein